MIDDEPLFALLKTLCPMHAVLNSTGHIVHAGWALKKIRPHLDMTGMRFSELVEIQRPRNDGSMNALRMIAGRKLHLQLRDAPRTSLKGVAVTLPEDGTLGPSGGAIVNLSFGISVIEAVRDYKLTSADFAATDLAIEMLYLVEAKTAAMDLSRTLNSRLRGAKIAAEEQAFTDTLTGLKNRRALDFVLNHLLEHEHDFALLHVDLDYFKAVNDSKGHAAGDFVLQQVARIMIDETRNEDTIARTGGDEFVIVLNRLTNPELVQDIADRLIARLEVPMEFNGQECNISGSAGSVLSAQTDGVNVAQLMEDADLALYAAKSEGRGCHVAYCNELRKSKPMSNTA